MSAAGSRCPAMQQGEQACWCSQSPAKQSKGGSSPLAGEPFLKNRSREKLLQNGTCSWFYHRITKLLRLGKIIECNCKHNTAKSTKLRQSQPSLFPPGSLGLTRTHTCTRAHAHVAVKACSGDREMWGDSKENNGAAPTCPCERESYGLKPQPDANQQIINEL